MLFFCLFFVFLNKELGLEILHNGIKIISIKGKIFDLPTSPSNCSTQQDSKWGLEHGTGCRESCLSILCFFVIKSSQISWCSLAVILDVFFFLILFFPNVLTQSCALFCLVTEKHCDQSCRIDISLSAKLFLMTAFRLMKLPISMTWMSTLSYCTRTFLTRCAALPSSCSWLGILIIWKSCLSTVTRDLNFS